MVRQMMLGLRSADAEVYEFDTGLNQEALDCDGRDYDRGTSGPVWLRWEKLRPIVESFRPELIVCNAGGLSFRPETARTLRQSCLLLGIALSDPDVFYASTSRIAGNFDLFLTNAPSTLADYRARGGAAEVLPLATNEEFFYPVSPRDEHTCEVLVIGRASPDRIQPVCHLYEHFRVHLYGEGWEQHGLPSRGLLYGEELLTALNSAAISVIFSRTPAGHEIGKVAIFDFIAGGALVATNYLSEVERYLQYDREIIGFADTDELMNKSRLYLSNPDRAAAVREAGRKRVLSEHTWRKVWPPIIERVQALRTVPC